MQEQEEIQAAALFQKISDPKDRQFVLALMVKIVARQVKQVPSLRLVLGGLPAAANNDLLSNLSRFENIEPAFPRRLPK